jgi:hypothetical protein
MLPHTEEATPILEINFRRLLLACESKNRATIRLHIQQASSSTHDTHPTGTSCTAPHSTITMLHQIEALESMLSELDSRARERTMNLHKELDLGVDMDTASSQEQINVTNQMENVKQWSHRTTLIVEQWKQHVATMERTEARATSVSPASPVLVQFRDTVPPLLNKTAGHHMERLPLRTPVAMQSSCPSSSKDLIATTNPTNTATTATTATTTTTTTAATRKKKRKKKRTFHKELRSWQKELGLLDTHGADTAHPSNLTGEEERQRLEEQTEKSLEEILETTTSLKGVVQQSQQKIQDDLKRIDETAKMTDANQAKVEKNTSKAKEQSKALWGDFFTEMKMAVAAVVMTLVVVLITRVPVVNLFFMKKF